MRIFLRSFALTLSLTLIIFSGLITMCAVSSESARSGFFSGEFFLVESKESSLSVEFLGKKVELDYSAVVEFIPKAEPAGILLPPSAELLIRAVTGIFCPKSALL